MIDHKVDTLLTVIEEGSFVAAAQKLCITQPAVSSQIKLLENELGVRILNRTNGKIVVTREGEAVVDCAKKITGLYNNMLRDLKDVQNRILHLTVGITHTAESSPVAEALAKYCIEHNDVNVKMVTETINSLYTKLKAYEIDLAIVAGRISDPSIRYMTLDTDSLVLAISPEHPLAGQNTVTLSQLKKERLILRLPNSVTRDLFAANLQSNNMSLNDFNVILEVDNVATIKDLIRRNFGVSILSKSVCLDELKKNKIVVLPVENLNMQREINIAYTQDFSSLDVVRDIIVSYEQTVQNYI